MSKRKIEGLLVYCCRRCGANHAVEPREKIKNRPQMRKLLNYLVTGKMIEFHDCRDGGIGISDLQGGE